jgi:hypothetical protein
MTTEELMTGFMDGTIQVGNYGDISSGDFMLTDNALGFLKDIVGEEAYSEYDLEAFRANP